jgi:hypothetical protein
VEEEFSYKINRTFLIVTYTQEKYVVRRNEGEYREKDNTRKERDRRNEREVSQIVKRV